MGCNDIEIRKSEFVAKTQFLCAALYLGKIKARDASRSQSYTSNFFV